MTLRDQVFISYSHRDSDWLARLQTAITPLVRNRMIDVWSDTRIKPGKRWREEIVQALVRAKVAILLVSQHFLASDFIANEEIPPILAAAHAEGLTVVWIPITASLYDETELAEYHAAHDPLKPLDSLSPSELHEALVDIAKKIKSVVATGNDEGDANAIAGRIVNEMPAASLGRGRTAFRAMLSDLNVALTSGGLRESELGRIVLETLREEHGAGLAYPFDRRVVENGIRLADTYFPKIRASAGMRDWQRDFAKTATPIVVAVARSIERSAEAHVIVVRLCERLAQRLRLTLVWPDDANASNDVKNSLYARCLAARELEDDDVLVVLQGLTVVGPS